MRLATQGWAWDVPHANFSCRVSNVKNLSQASPNPEAREVPRCPIYCPQAWQVMEKTIGQRYMAC